jgi:hypothetical protein
MLTPKWSARFYLLEYILAIPSQSTKILLDLFIPITSNVRDYFVYSLFILQNLTIFKISLDL